MAELQAKLKDTNLAAKYGLRNTKTQDHSGKFDFRQFIQNNRDDSSATTSIPPNPRLLYEKMIKKSKWYQKDGLERAENAFVGRLGNYVIGENLEERLEQRNRGSDAHFIS